MQKRKVETDIDLLISMDTDLGASIVGVTSFNPEILLIYNLGASPVTCYLCIQ